jgi:CMP-N-acetylneuraminate monooxygenase
MKKLGHFDVKIETISFECKIDNLKVGINSLKNHFVIVDENFRIESVIDKTCDHAGGRLIQKGSSAICPMHGWKLNFKTLKYQDSHVKKTSIDFNVINNNLCFNDHNKYLVNPFKALKKNTNLKFRWLNHACAHVTDGNLSIVTDPWLKGSAFLTGWWLDEVSTSDSVELVKNADYIYISHNHPDHLHPETLSLVDKNKKIIVGNFSSNSTEKYLNSLGFNNIHALDFNIIYEIGNDFQLCLFKSGDFRDDSGIYLNNGGIETLMTVDSNFLNSYVLPKNINLLMTSFAGGASGFPLCYNNYNLEQKNNISKRNKLAIRASVLGYIKETSPKYFMPYAGMFKEKSKRDSYIKVNNIKNSTDDYQDIVEQNGTKFISPKKDLLYSFKDGELLKTKLNVTYLPSEKIEESISEYKLLYKYESKVIIDYLKSSGYIGKQILYIIPTNDDFTKVTNDIIYCNFKSQDFYVINKNNIIKESENFKTMQLLVREEIFAAVVENKFPWEDFSIGFQMRVVRFPNEYESDFWYHFTNNYINSIYYKNDPNCGACELIKQNPLLNKKI